MAGIMEDLFGNRGGGGGGSVDYSRVVEKIAAIPSVEGASVGKVYMYDGVSNATYTHGYIYECVATQTATAVAFSGNIITSWAVADFVSYMQEGGSAYDEVTHGSLTYDASGGLWDLVGYDANGIVVMSFHEYTEDLEDFGCVFASETHQDGDNCTFTLTTEVSGKKWQRIDVQPAGGTGGVASVNGKTGTVVLTAEDVKAIPQYETMPLASSSNNGHIVQFTGTTDSSYTNGYFYKCSASGTEITSGSCVVSDFIGDISDTPIPTISFNKATFDAYLQSNNLDPVTSPDIEFSIGSNPETGDPVLEVTYNSVVAAITIDMNDTDVSTIETTMATLGFTATISEDTGFASCNVALPTNSSYVWERIDVQPDAVTSVNGQTGDVTVQETLVSGTNIKTINNNSILGGGNLDIDALPSQTGNAGKVLKTNGTTASWEDTTSTPATTPTLAVADWSSNTQTISVTGVTATNTVIVSPTPVSAEDYATAGVLCTNQGAGTLTFTCQSTPANDLTVNIVII